MEAGALYVKRQDEAPFSDEGLAAWRQVCALHGLSLHAARENSVVRISGPEPELREMEQTLASGLQRRLVLPRGRPRPCPKCQADMALKVGPFGRDAQIYGRLWCQKCQHKQHSPWPDAEAIVAAGLADRVCDCGAAVRFVDGDAGKKIAVEAQPIAVEIEGEVRHLRPVHAPRCARARGRS